MSQTDYENNEAIRLGPVANSKELSFGSKGIEFAHQFTGGELALNLNSALNTPSIMSANGFVNASPAEIASAYLGTFKKKLRLSLSRGIELKPYIHYVVTGNTIVFVGALRDTGGAQAGEIIFGQIEQVKANGMIVGDMRWFHGTTEVAVGQTLVNIGIDFKVNENADSQVGDVKLKQNGTAIYRNVGNATAGPSADGHYQENDAGNGYGTTVTLNAAPVGQPALIEYEVGVKLSSGDAQIWSDLERLEGSILALAEDAAQGFYGDNDLTRYIAASATALERRGFGDLLFSILSRLNNVVYDNFHFVEYTGATLPGTRILPSVLNQQIGSGAFDISQVISNGRFKTLKAGWYSFTGKGQMTGLGTVSIARNDSAALNGNNSAVLASHVPVTAQEYTINWTGYLPANETVAFNANTGPSANNATQMWSASFLGTKAPTSI